MYTYERTLRRKYSVLFQATAHPMSRHCPVVYYSLVDKIGVCCPNIMGGDEQLHSAKQAIHENNGLTIGEQKNTIQNFYNPLLTEFYDMIT